jgi:hypothetical protein
LVAAVFLFTKRSGVEGRQAIAICSFLYIGPEMTWSVELIIRGLNIIALAVHGWRSLKGSLIQIYDIGVLARDSFQIKDKYVSYVFLDNSVQLAQHLCKGLAIFLGVLFVKNVDLFAHVLAKFVHFVVDCGALVL